MVAHPQNVFVQRRGRTLGTAYHAEEDLLILRCHVSKRSGERVQLARAPTTRDHADSLEPQAVAMDVDDPQESSGAECAASTSELGGEAVILEEETQVKMLRTTVYRGKKGVCIVCMLGV